MNAPKSFEEGLQRLQQILAQMQDDSTSLNDSVKLYAEAAQLIEYCDKALNSAKLKIDEIDLQLEKQRAGTDGDPDEQ